MGAVEMFKPDGTYMRLEADGDTVLLSKWAHCDKCLKPYEKSTLTLHSELWLCATCR
jgi:hypothetical protein